MIFDLGRLVRKNIQDLKPYSSARSEFAGTADIFLDANENAFGSPAGDGYNRYPDPLQTEIKQKVAEIKNIDSSQIFVGNGSDEAIDLLFRIFCEPGRDEVIICPPTYGMYRVSSNVNDVAVMEIPLTAEFQLDVPSILSGISDQTKIIFICSPNNPTGNLMQREMIFKIAEKFDGIVVVDEAYIDFAKEPSFTAELALTPNLVILQTFSKAWGMAGVRVGLAFASKGIIDLMNRVKPPYNVSGIAQRTVLEALNDFARVDRWIELAVQQRAVLADSLNRFACVEKIYPSDANFVLVKVVDANSVYKFLLDEGIVVRNRNNVELCHGCLRVTVGTAEENTRLTAALSKYSESKED